ncbi:MAG: hypothetical protein KZY74_05400 [Paenibacillaceae bacterium]|nr:hypothetical protein [Paenibacillaceae bacterium]
MATTSNLNLPLIPDNAVNNVKRDMNALAEAVDTAVTERVSEANSAAEAAQTTANAANLAAAAAQTKADQAFQLGNERKQQVVDALIAWGISASTSESWDSLFAKMTAILNRGAQVITPGTANKPILAGYHNGSGYVVGDAKLLPENIKKGISIFNVTGTYKRADFIDANMTSGGLVPYNGQTEFIIATFPAGTTEIAFGGAATAPFYQCSGADGNSQVNFMLRDSIGNYWYLCGSSYSGLKININAFTIYPQIGSRIVNSNNSGGLSMPSGFNGAGNLSLLFKVSPSGTPNINYSFAGTIFYR